MGRDAAFTGAGRIQEGREAGPAPLYLLVGLTMLAWLAATQQLLMCDSLQGV